jgi:hypothetical protein
VILWDFTYVVFFTFIVGWFAIHRLRKRLVD